MQLERSVYRTVVVAHVAASVSWLGASLVLLFLGVRVLTAADGGVQYAAGTAAAMLAGAVAPVLGAAALGSGLLLSVGTRWTLRYRWVQVKLVATAVTLTLTVVLLGPGLRELAAALDPDRLAAVDGRVVAGPVVSSLVYLSLIAVTYVKPWRRGRVPGRAVRAPARSVR
jgi:hypothetical protein